MTDAIRVDDLSRKFGEFTAVDRVSFAVPAGEIFGLLGPNGAGKTTVIKMLTGLLAPSGGTGSVAGFDLTRGAESIRQRIGYMSQLFSLYGDLTVAENIELFAGLYGVTGGNLTERRSWVLEMAGLTGQADRMTAELPLGWKQRLALGCAVLHRPSILFLDEPTSGVDPISRRKFWDLIYALAAEGTTALVSTHYMEEAEFCQRIGLMNRGRLIALDRPAALRAGIPHPIVELDTSDVLGCVGLLEGAPGVHEAVMFGRRVHATVSDAAAAIRELPGFLRQRGITVHSAAAVTPSLEDVVVELIRAAGGRSEN